MRKATITGDLVTADMTTQNQTITVEANLGREKTAYSIGVPLGLMDIVMPAHWGQRVAVAVVDDPQLSVYTLEDIREALDDEPSGLTAQ